jgi:transcription elongation factor Elf1
MRDWNQCEKFVLSTKIKNGLTLVKRRVKNMKIIKEGSLQARKFNCQFCGCEFIANIGEYRLLLKDRGAHVQCPYCHHHLDVVLKDASLYVEE